MRAKVGTNGEVDNLFDNELKACTAMLAEMAGNVDTPSTKNSDMQFYKRLKSREKEIKEDIEDVCERLKPRAQPAGKTVFRGWARMALPLSSFKLYKVGRPFLGESRPSEVRAEAQVSLSGCRGDVRARRD